MEHGDSSKDRDPVAGAYPMAKAWSIVYTVLQEIQSGSPCLQMRFRPMT
jgi:hypothetical protein